MEFGRMMRALRWMMLPSALAACWLLTFAGRAAEKTEPMRADEVSFNQDIRPILSNRCFKCHGPDLKKAGMNLRDRDSAVKKAILPGKAAESPLIARVTSTDAKKKMPAKGDALTADQVAKLRAWIDQGAKYEEHWAYVKPIHRPLPEVK